MVNTRRVHAVVDGEIAADQVRPHGGALAREDLGFIGDVRLVFAVVHADDAGVAAGRGVG